MKFSTGVFVFDFSLAVVLALLGPWPFAFVGGLVAGAVLAWVYKGRIQNEADAMFNRYKRIDIQGKVDVESAFRAAEKRLFGKKV